MILANIAKYSLDSLKTTFVAIRLRKVPNGIKEIVHFKQKISQKTIKTVKKIIIALTNPKMIANAFNNYFANGVNLVIV